MCTQNISQKGERYKYLRTYLRNKLATKLIPLLKKEKCEICGATDDLEVHHVKLFSEILDETLEELGLEYRKKIEEYSSKELNLIVNQVLGKHLDIEYLTLCDNCHEHIHKNMWTEISCNDKYKAHCNKIRFIKSERDKQNTKKLIVYLDSILDKRLYKNEQEELIQFINLRQNGKRIKTPKNFNIDFEQRNVPYKIDVSKPKTYRDDSGKVRKELIYWQVNKIQSNII